MLTLTEAAQPLTIDEYAEDYGRAYADGRRLGRDDLRDAYLRGAQAQREAYARIDTLHIPDPTPMPVGSMLNELIIDIQENVEKANGADLTHPAWGAMNFGIQTAHAVGMQLGAAYPQDVAKKQAAEKARRK